MTLDEALGRVEALTEEERAEVRAECEADVSRPGKYEGQAPHVPYFHAAALNGLQDDTWYDGDFPFDVFTVRECDRAIFPNLTVGGMIVIYEIEQGFVCEGSPEDIAKQIAENDADADADLDPAGGDDGYDSDIPD